MKANLKASLLRRQVLQKHRSWRCSSFCCSQLWKTLLEKRSVMQKEQGRNMSSLLFKKDETKHEGERIQCTVKKEVCSLQATLKSVPTPVEIIVSERKSHLDSVPTASLPRRPEIQDINEGKDVRPALLCSWDPALAPLLLPCATPGMLGHYTLKLTSGWTGGVLVPAEKRLQSRFSHLNFWFRSKSQKMQPTLSNSQGVDPARQFLAQWTTTSYFLDQEDTPETNLPWFRPCWQITDPASFLPLLELLPGNELHTLQMLILLH